MSAFDLNVDTYSQRWNSVLISIFQIPTFQKTDQAMVIFVYKLKTRDSYSAVNKIGHTERLDILKIWKKKTTGI